MTEHMKQKEREVEVEMPILSVDESLSVEERMTANAYHNILPARYLLEGEDPEDLFSRVAENVAKAEADEVSEEMWADEFEHMMATLQFMPNSPTLMNAGGSLQQLSACFVLEPGDSMAEPDEFGRESILDTVKHAGQIFKSGGGVGYSFSALRPKGAYIESTESETSGPMQFMRLYDETCETVKQGGKRRGAQMGIMRVDHADIGRFITAKRVEGNLDNFNISVALTDEFIEAVRNDELYTFYDPQTDFDGTQDTLEETVKFYSPEYADNPVDFQQANAEDKVGMELVDENLWRDYADSIEAHVDYDSDERVSLKEKWGDDARMHLKEGEVMQLPARFIWDLIIDGAWRNGEPGLFHLDETNRQHSFDAEKHPHHEINATNPCAEQPLSAYEACNLGHINLSLMMKDDSLPFEEWKKQTDYDYQFEKSAVTDYVEENVDWEQLQKIARHGTRFLDNVVTMSDFPLEEITQRVKGQRKIGLGIMGWAQMLYQMGIPYGSDESYQAARVVMGFIDKESTKMSHELAEERGSFEYWDESKYANPTEYPQWFHEHTYEDPENWEDGYPIRNHNTTTIAPTGTTSMIANTTGGCEPAYNVANFKNVGDDIQGSDMLVEFDDYFLKTLEANGIDVEAVKEDAESKMRNNEFDGVDDLSIPEEIARVFVTTNDLSSRQHGLMQRAFQEFVDSGISKTINAPNSATRNDVHEAFMLALDEDELGQTIKGLTFYRDGSRDEQVLTTRVDNNLDKEDETDVGKALLYELGGEDKEWSEEDVEKFLEDAEDYVENRL
ncbi:ribonucleotide reductase [Halogranum tailed virus 1]|uniref:ribonucleoside-diphosphate reductase n=1 Tax=Halogranum tailed virus 1 TaxID=1273749 RepID=R4TGP7_9CAUD|nr:ribonucleotide reductase [Halogranum tailed virus 1]AGM11406.1 ribonucleotide reductase [Halogranum tailed virus 1]